MKLMCGVFQWDDGQITAGVIRDDMFERAGVKLLAETFFMPEAIELANAWSRKVVRFITLDQFRSVVLPKSAVSHQIVGSGILKVGYFGEDEPVFYAVL